MALIAGQAEVLGARAAPGRVVKAAEGSTDAVEMQADSTIDPRTVPLRLWRYSEGKGSRYERHRLSIKSPDRETCYGHVDLTTDLLYPWEEYLRPLLLRSLPAYGVEVGGPSVEEVERLAVPDDCFLYERTLGRLEVNVRSLSFPTVAMLYTRQGLCDVLPGYEELTLAVLQRGGHVPLGAGLPEAGLAARVSLQTEFESWQRKQEYLEKERVKAEKEKKRRAKLRAEKKALAGAPNATGEPPTQRKRRPGRPPCAPLPRHADTLDSPRLFAALEYEIRTGHRHTKFDRRPHPDCLTPEEARRRARWRDAPDLDPSWYGFEQEQQRIANHKELVATTLAFMPSIEEVGQYCARYAGHFAHVWAADSEQGHPALWNAVREVVSAQAVRDDPEATAVYPSLIELPLVYLVSDQAACAGLSWQDSELDCAICGEATTISCIPAVAVRQFRRMRYCAHCSYMALRGITGARSDEQDVLAVQSLSNALGQLPTCQVLSAPVSAELADETVDRLVMLRMLAPSDPDSDLFRRAGLIPTSERRSRGIPSTANDGHSVSSLFERAVDDYLHAAGIVHTREPSYPFHPRLNRNGARRADWLLADGTYLEAAGMTDDDYLIKMIEKRQLCEELGLKYREIKPQDLPRLASILAPVVANPTS